MITQNDITGIILAGGKSSRMGTDKGLLTLNNKPFIQYCIEALQPLVSEIIIVSSHTDHDAFQVKRIGDIIEDAGPVSGIYSGLKASKTTYNLILSCDIPLIHTSVLKQLIAAVDDTSEIIQMESRNKTMPLIALYKKSCGEKFLKQLQQDERRLRIAVKQCRTKTIRLDSEYDVFTTNVNTPEALKALPMNITIKYFGLIAEITQQDEESIIFSGTSIAELLDLLYLKYNTLKHKDFQIAQNQELVTLNHHVSGEEIAILPPFAGG